MNLQRAGGLILPQLFKIAGYTIYFWAKEDGEPIHVHISPGKPSQNATKIWITRSGGTIVAHNRSKIPEIKLRYLRKIVGTEYLNICNKWELFIGNLNFYC